MQDEAFDYLLYRGLLMEDREMIDEYIPRMTPGEINSFMRRLVSHSSESPIEDVLEVNEDLDAVLVFEQNNISSGSPKRFSFSRIDHVLKQYFTQYDLKNDHLMYSFCKALSKYFKEQFEIFYDEWIYDKNFAHKIREYFTKLVGNQNYFYKVENIQLSTALYTYRTNKDGSTKKRLGIVLDRAAFLHRNGYSKNFHANKQNVKIKPLQCENLNELAPYIKNICFWAPKNAIRDGFDNKTGIIWFNGKSLGHDKWQLSQNVVIANNIQILVNITFTSDAFSKMLQRFDFNNRIKNIILAFESKNST